MVITKLKMLQRFKNEKEFRESVLLPLFEKLGYHTVLNHGTQEFGKDIILSTTNAIGIKKYTSLVVKKGNINVGCKKDNSNLYDVSRQVKESYLIKYCEPTEKKEIKIDNAFVICDGTISDNAKRIIVEEWGASKELYEKNTEFIPGDKLVDIIKKNWPIFFETNSPDFYEFAKKLMDLLNQEEKVRAISVNDKIHDLSKQHIKSSLFEIHKTRDKRYKKLPRNADTVFDKTKRILLVGESGVGKSHLLREQIKRAIIHEMNSGDSPRLKVYIKLSEFAEIFITSACIKEILYDYLHRVWDKAPKDYLEVFLRDRNIDFYLDGYDEIPTEENRKTARENIIFLIAEFPSSRFVITTREISAILNQEFPESFRRFNLSPIGYKQAVEYLELIVEKSSKNGSEVLKQIRQQEILLILPRTPMTVQLITSLFSENSSKEIPSNTTEIYKIFTEIMLGRWDKQRDVTNIFDYEQKVTLLSELALLMQNGLLDCIDYQKAIEISENFLGGYGDDSKKGKQVLDEIIFRSELLILSNNGIRFKHRSFQEYFAAYKIHTQSIDFREFAKHVSDPWWENVITFICGFRKNADEIIDYVIGLTKPEGLDEDLFKFRRGKNLGLYVRAGYQSKNDKKKKSLEQSIEDFEFCYDSEELRDRIKGIIKRKPGKNGIHIALQLILSHAYYSKLTHQVVNELVEKMPSERRLSLMLKLVSDYKDKETFDLAVERINKTKEIDIKMACATVCDAFARGDDVKLLESKVFRKLRKSAGFILKQPIKKDKNPKSR